MLFNEIVERDGIEDVASKTNISTVNLGYLIDENFERLNRVKALGFLLILEREYKEIDVAALRDRIKTYYDEHRPVDEKVVMVGKDSVEESGFSFFKLFIILALLVAGIYFYTQGKLDSVIDNVEEKKEFFDDEKALESNVTAEDANKVVVGKSHEESVTIETPVAPKTSPVGLNEKSTVSDMAPEVHLALAENSLRHENKSVSSVVKEVSEAFLANEANSSIEALSENENSAESDITITTVNINPTRGMLWFGFINLDNKKRREFMKKVSTPFNIGENRWLLVTGHGYLDVVSDEKTIELADNKKHYFYIDRSEIKEISKAEFRKLNGRRGW